MQSSKSLSSASEPTCFLEQSETLEITPSKTPKTNFAKVHLDEKTEVSENSSVLKYFWLYLRCLFGETNDDR